MDAIIQWINTNSGAIMVFITIVYVWATINISISNKKSAKASQEQIEASQKQQAQNAGLQLYALRKDAINKVAQKQYDEVFWDIPLLFDNELFSEFQALKLKTDGIKSYIVLIENFENTISTICGKIAYDNIKCTRESVLIGLSSYSIADLREQVSQIVANRDFKCDITERVNEYVELVDSVKNHSTKIQTENLQLVLKLHEFVRKSIQ